MLLYHPFCALTDGNRRRRGEVHTRARAEKKEGNKKKGARCNASTRTKCGEEFGGVVRRNGRDVRTWHVGKRRNIISDK